MTVDNLMDRKVFTLAGDTLNEDKYAYKIKGALLGAGYKVHCVGKELASLDEVPEEKIEVLGGKAYHFRSFRFLYVSESIPLSRMFF